MAYNLKALQVTDGENFTVSEAAVEGDAALRLEPVSEGEDYNVKVRVVADGAGASMSVFFTGSTIIDGQLVDDLGGNVLVDALGGNVLVGE